MPRAVSFDDQAQVYLVPDLAEECDKSDLWFSPLEIQGFKHRVATVVRRVMASDITMAQYAEINAEETHAFMGLEAYLTTEMPRVIARRRLAVSRAVLAEQRRQLRAGVSDPDAMVRASEAESAPSLKRSRIIALIHAEKR